MKLKVCIFLLFFVETLIPNPVYYAKFLRKEITTSLTLNYYHLYQGKCYFPKYPTFAILDSTCMYSINFKKTDKKLKIRNYNYELYSYNFSFEYSCSKDNWMSENNENIYFDKIDIYSSVNEIYLPINQLHLNGLIAYDSLAGRYLSISGTSVIDDLDIKLLKRLDSINVKNVIELKYFNYNPKEIVLDLIKNEFSLYSEILERRINGNIIYDMQFDSYKLRLENGILINN